MALNLKKSFIGCLLFILCVFCSISMVSAAKKTLKSTVSTSVGSAKVTVVADGPAKKVYSRSVTTSQRGASVVSGSERCSTTSMQVFTTVKVIDLNYNSATGTCCITFN